MIGSALGMLGLISIPAVLMATTKFKWKETENSIGTDLAARSNGVGALCGANSCADLSPSTVNLYGTGGTVIQQFLSCNDTSSIECEYPDLITEEHHLQTAMVLILEFEQDEAAGVDFLQTMYIKVPCRITPLLVQIIMHTYPGCCAVTAMPYCYAECLDLLELMGTR